MGAFEYEALDPSGRTTRGVLEGDTPRQVRSQLRTKGLSPLSVEPVASAPADKEQASRRRQKGGRLSSLDLALMTRQLATLLRSGQTVEQTLHTAAQQTSKASVQRVLLAVRSRVREGHSLASGMSNFPNVFPELYHRTVAAGEEAGFLAPVLERLADYTENRQALRQKTLLALFYPIMLTVVSLIVVIVLLAYVVPQVTGVYENIDQDLPGITLFLIAISEMIQNYGLLIGTVAIVVIVLVSASLRRETMRLRWHRLLLRLPVIGRLIQNINAARFARTLSILAQSGVPILDAMRIAAEVLTNVPMRGAVEEATLRIREGSSIHSALENTGYFPPITLSLLASGESSGDLEGMLSRAADIQEREVETTLATAMALFEPLLILFMGGLVLFIVLAILLPIFNLNALVQ